MLSIPAFQWSIVETEAPKRGRAACAIHGNHMIASGGIDRTDFLNYVDNGDDPWNHALGVFDLNTLAWKGSYESSGIYESSDLVDAIYSAW